jgi:hypothetical protein
VNQDLPYSRPVCWGKERGWIKKRRGKLIRKDKNIYINKKINDDINNINRVLRTNAITTLVSPRRCNSFTQLFAPANESGFVISYTIIAAAAPR